MLSYLRSGLVLIVAVTVAVGITTLPIRAADESKDLQSRIEKLEKKVATLQAKLKYVSVEMEPINGLAGPHVIFEGCNVHVRSGSGASTDGTVDLVNQMTIPDTAPLGLGNLIVGYNEQPTKGSLGRGGSHNLIVGPGHDYPSVAGVLFGQENSAMGPLASVTSGYLNTASGYFSSVSGGAGNTASGNYSSVTGGASNTASGYASSVSGGGYNTASGSTSSVSGGYGNTASNYYSSVSGGGASNTASGEFSSVSGGAYNTASGTDSSVSGGFENTASGGWSSVSGGNSGSAPGAYDWVAGSLFEDF
jgi:hypothetical protein